MELSFVGLSLVPMAFYLSITADMPDLLKVEGFANWRASVQAMKSFTETQPQQLRQLKRAPSPTHRVEAGAPGWDGHRIILFEVRCPSA